MASSNKQQTASPAPAWLLVAAAAVAAGFGVPLVYLIVENLFGEGSPFAFLTGEELGPLIRSIALAAGVAVAATTLGTTAAWLVGRTDVPGRRLLKILLPLPLVIPSYIGAFVLIATFASGGFLEKLLGPLGVESLPPVRGYLGSFFVLTVLTFPYVYLPVSARLRQLPSSLEESARLLGSSPWVTFFRVVLPQARSSIMAGSLLIFLYTISDFGVVQLMRYDALTRVIYSTRLFDRPTSLALSLQLGLLALLVVAVERSATSGPRQTRGGRTSRALVVTTGRWRLASIAFLVILVGISLVIPVGVLIYWAARGIAGGSTSGVLVTSDLWRITFNTAAASIAAAVVAVAVILPVAYTTVRHRGKVADGLNAVVVGSFALPGLAIALAIVYLAVSTPALSSIYQTLPLLIAAYVVHFGAQALRAGQVALSSVPLAVEDAARVLGVRRWQRFVRVELPLMRPGLIAGGGLVLLSAMKELPASLLLAPAGFQTLAMKVWQATESAFFADAAIAALVLIVLSGVLTWALVIRREDAL